MDWLSCSLTVNHFQLNLQKKKFNNFQQKQQKKVKVIKQVKERGFLPVY